MKLTLEIDASTTLNDTEIAVLEALIRVSNETTDQQEPAPAKAVKVEVTEPKPPTPAKKATPKPVPQEDQEDGPTLDQAVAKATELISAGKTAQVKAALDTAGAKRVGQLEGDAIGRFMDALS